MFLSLSSLCWAEGHFADSKTWLRLLHYQTNGFGDKKSAIHSKDFFLADNGAVNPLAEFNASLTGMLEPVVAGNENEHAKCRFPARRIWLQKIFPDLHEALGEIHCPAMFEWFNLNELQSISIVFANGYLGNPASYYGHLFIKLNTSVTGGSHLISQTANFGAINTLGDNPVMYIAKAITGGYEAGFSPVDFFFHDANYGETELRDLWEYQLNLDGEDIKFIASHLWEVNRKKYTYYFFHDNCAYRVAELLEIVDGVVATPPLTPWVLPISVLQTASKSNFKGKSLISKNIYYPSRQSRFYQKLSTLGLEQKQFISEIVSDQTGFKSQKFESMRLRDQYRVIDTLLDYYLYIYGGVNKSEHGRLPEGYVKALSTRIQLPPGAANDIYLEPSSPDKDMGASLFQVGASISKGGKESLSFRIRPAYFDALDAGVTQAKFSSLGMGDLRLVLEESRLRVSSMDIISVTSIKPSFSGLAGDGGMGWSLKIGWEQEKPVSITNIIPRFQLDALLGTFFLASNVYSYMNLGGALQEKTALGGAGFTRVGGGLIAYPSKNISIRVASEIRYPFMGNEEKYSVSFAEGRFSLGASHDLRFLFERDVQSKATIGLGFYW